MKKIFVGLLGLSLLTESFTADAARYFTQGDNAGSSTPYDDNLKVGKYVQSFDTKIYYEVTAAAIFPFMNSSLKDLTSSKKLI